MTIDTSTNQQSLPGSNIWLYAIGAIAFWLYMQSRKRT